VRVEFLRDEDGTLRVAAAATWNGASVEFEAGDQQARELLERIFRPAPVSVDDPSLRSFGTRGEVILQPGSLRWVMAAARTRGEAEGLRVRFVSTGPTGVGWDPAGAYRTFASAAERLAAIPSPRTVGSSAEGALSP
jgi:hypothetical protein